MPKTQRSATLTEDPTLSSPKFALDNSNNNIPNNSPGFSLLNNNMDSFLLNNKSSERFLNATTLAYVRRCVAFQIRPDPAVLAALETQWHVMQISPNNVREGCLLPLVDVLSTNGCAHVRELRVVPSEELRETRADGFSGDVDCRCLSKILTSNKTIVELDIAYLGLGPAGMDEIASIVKLNSTLRRLRIAHNPGGRNHYGPLIDALKQNNTLKILDVSYNHLGFSIIQQLKQAGIRNIKGNGTNSNNNVRIESEGNHIVEEAVNTLTHFIGLIIALCAVFVLMNDLSNASSRAWWSCFAYSITLLLMFTCSMVFHALTNRPRIAQIANICDHSAIYALIAGSCSPFLHVALQHSHKAWYVACAQWCLALIGITFNMYGNHTVIKRRQTIEMILYFTQGLIILFVKDELAQVVGNEVTQLVWRSGITYAVGSIFFVAEHAVHPIGHGIWHLFVCAGAMFHWNAVYIFIQGLPRTASTTATTTTAVAIDAICREMISAVTAAISQHDQDKFVIGN
jgi:hemolysin III